MSSEHHHGGIGKYVLVVLILAVITFLEFAIVEYQVDWLSTAGKLTGLAVMSLVKFLMVIWFFMHLKDDSKTYTGFFSSGMVIAMGTFIALAALFTVRTVMNVRDDVVVSHGGEHHEVVKIPERAFVDTLRVPAPKNQHVQLPIPLASQGGFQLKALPGFVSADALSGTTLEETVSATPNTPESMPVVTMAQWDKAMGEQAFGNCSACHQPTGQGVPGAFPPLAKHVPDLYNAEGGREYLINVVLYGLQGEIEVDGAKFNGIMTPWGPLLKDEQIANVLNYALTSWDNEVLLKDFVPLTAEEVATARSNNFSSQQVHELRSKLTLE